jgi:hypothetical protein
MTSIGEYFDRTRIRGINEGIGREDIVQSFHGTPSDGGFELPVGPKGPDGPQGPAAHPFKHEGDVSDIAALNALATRLRPAHAGKAWRVKSTNRLMVWNGRSFDTFTDAFGGHGPVGETNTLSVGTVTTGAAGTEASVTITGTPPEQTIDLTIPRGVKGAKGPIGPPGPLRESSDYDDTVAHVDRMVPMWNPSTEKWTPTPYPGWRGPWTLVEGQSWSGTGGFVATNSSTTNPRTIAEISIPAQNVAWRPFVTGGALIRLNNAGNAQASSLYVHLGSTSGQRVAWGRGMPDGAWAFANLVPLWYDVSAMTPASTAGVVAAGASVTLYVLLSSGAGTTYSLQYDRTKAHLAVWAVPVTGAPE